MTSRVKQALIIRAAPEPKRYQTRPVKKEASSAAML
jgi:hypothetical protein